MPEFIKWAACRVSGRVFTALTHYDAYSAAATAQLCGSDIDDVSAHAEDGFLTNLDRFVDREEAYQIALAAQQHTPAMGKNPGETWLDYAEVERDPRYAVA